MGNWKIIYDHWTTIYKTGGHEVLVNPLGVILIEDTLRRDMMFLEPELAAAIAAAINTAVFPHLPTGRKS